MAKCRFSNKLSVKACRGIVHNAYELSWWLEKSDVAVSTLEINTEKKI